METDKYLHLPSVSWRTWKAIKVVLSQTRRTENQERQQYPSVQVPRPEKQERWCQGQEKTDIPAQADRSKFSFPLPFYSILALSGLDDAHPLWWARFFIQSATSQMAQW